MKEKNRIFWIDAIRSICIILIIASHVFGTSNWILQLLFGFNVPALVIISGYSSNKSADVPLLKYYKKRFNRIVLPSWIFFALYFPMVAIISIGDSYPYSWLQVLKTFCFMDGIGFTWILAIFVMLAIVTPWFKYISRKKGSIALILYLISAGCLFCFPCLSIILKGYLYVAGYVALAFFGYRFEECFRNVKYLTLGGAVCLFIGAFQKWVKGVPLYNISVNKYPPSIYYVLYGVVVFYCLYYMLKNTYFITKSRLKRVTEHFSIISFDVYLWHILGLFVTSKINNNLIRFMLVIIFSIVCAEVCIRLKQQIEGKNEA